MNRSTIVPAAVLVLLAAALAAVCFDLGGAAMILAGAFTGATTGLAAAEIVRVAR